MDTNYDLYRSKILNDKNGGKIKRIKTENDLQGLYYLNFKVFFIYEMGLTVWAKSTKIHSCSF